MKTFYFVVLCAVLSFANALYSDEESDLQELCCTHGQIYAIRAPSAGACADAGVPEDLEPEQVDTCKVTSSGCCRDYFKDKDLCKNGMTQAAGKRCSVPKSEIGKTCCEECTFGRLTGESQGREACGSADEEEVIPSAALRSYAYVTCCVEAAETPETTTEKKVETTTEKKLETTTQRKVETTTEKKVRETCKKDSCDHVCNDEDGLVHCQCHEGYRLQGDKKICKDINECAETSDDLCTSEGTVCHNTAGSFKCVPIRKRDVGMTCPPGFKRNVQNQVCDDINECQLPRPPCPKYLCENTIGGYKCSGKAGTPFAEDAGAAPTAPPAAAAPRNDICPSGFRAGEDDECLDIDECEERLDDCQRLSQHCINTHGLFFCQDHVSKRCAPGFKVNGVTGKCEDINECEESSEVCRRTEVCINLPGAYNCKSKISTLPKLARKTCQEGTRARPGGTICEDIDECREGSHLCDQFQNCINTYGGHECRCKNGFELDSSSGSCIDIDECGMKLDNCGPGLYCLNVLGSFTCTRRAPATSTTQPTIDYYYDSEEDYSSSDDRVLPTTANTTTPKPTYATYPTYPVRPATTTTRRNRPDRPRNTRPTVPTTTSTEPPTTPKNTATTPEETPRETTAPARPDPRPPYIPRPPELPPRPEDRRNEAPRRPDFRPSRPTEPPRRPQYTPPISTTEPSRIPEVPTEVSVTPPDNSDVLEKDKNPDGSYGLNTSDIPKDKWTTVIGRDKSEEPAFDVNDIHCLYGYERDPEGNCVDMDECAGDRHICSGLEMCVNMEGGYRCDCVSGFHRDPSGWCAPTRLPPPRVPPTRDPPTRATTARSTTVRTTTSTTTERPSTETTTVEVATTPRPRYTPPARPRRPVMPPTSCEMGYTFNSSAGECVDIDECAIRSICAANEECHNVDGGYYCRCDARCRAANEKPAYEPPRTPQPREPSPPRVPYPQPRDPHPQPRDPSDSDSNIITVGAQYGQRGPRYLRPTFSRLPNSGAILSSCPWGYKLTPDNLCFDIDECAKNASQCGPQQRCENFFGGYSCQCPAGHKLFGKDGCEDIDECRHGTPCSYNSNCVNTVGSYRCECGDGFRNSPSNDKVCVDVDECSETPDVCQQNCANAWGGYRCYCKRGFRLDNDNRTCTDVDECAEWSASRLRGRLCGGTCLNEPGSFKCACPTGYRLGDDGKSCIDIDECESGEATCAASPDPNHVCQNTRGGYHCHRIDCPTGYKLEAKHRCTRIQRSCPVTDWGCLQQPSAYSYNFITFVANLYMPTGSVDLFTMHGPAWRESVVSFELRMIDVQAAAGVKPADLRCFDMRPMDNVCVISLLCSLGGPQVAELELTMSLYQRGQFAGNAVARLIIIVSEYDF